jgi:hypothetical protein
MKPHTKAAAVTAVKWAAGLSAGYILAPIIVHLGSGTAVPEKLIAEKLIGGIVWFPILFFGLWAWGALSKKNPVTGAAIDSEKVQTKAPAATEVQGMSKTGPTPLLPPKVESAAPIVGKQQTVIDEDPIYTAIAKELETGVADKGLWIRLFAECGGDEKQTKVLYIKQRADRLIAAERLRLEQAARKRAAEIEERLLLQQEARKHAAETEERLRLEQAARKHAAETEERLRLEQAARKRAAEIEERLRLEKAARERRAAEIERAEKLRPPPSDAQQMKEYCISFDGERYTYGEYKYDKLADAINYAKLEKKRSTHHST